MNKKLVIVIPYFGEWPAWINFYLLSCSFNPDVDWILYTDCGTVDSLPSNVTIKEMTFFQYKKIVSEKLNIIFEPESPYKLCDIKPALGYIHVDDIMDYEFWAFGDIDLVYGRLLNYFLPMMKKYDLISNHATRISGHLTIIKNSEKYLEAFKNGANWQECFSDSMHWAYDEKQFSKIFLRGKNLPYKIRRFIDFFSGYRRSAIFLESYSTPGCRVPWRDGSRNFPSIWYWDNGSLTNDIDGEKELPYFHFLAWKTGWGKTTFSCHASQFKINSSEIRIM